MSGTSNNALTGRRFDLDNLRNYLTGLVVVHHTAIVYGGPGEWHYHSRLLGQGTRDPLLMTFNGYNHSFFMGLFFWISGRVSAQSMHRALQGTSPKSDHAGSGAAVTGRRQPAAGTGNTKAAASGLWAFVKPKLLRLGVPAVVYSAAVFPIAVVLALPRYDKASVLACLGQQWQEFKGTRGPVWYVSTLLLFDLLAAATVKLLDAAHVTVQLPTQVYGVLSRYGWVVSAAVSFLVRTQWPVQGSFRMPLLAGRPGFFPQYAYAYALGWLAFEQDEPRMKNPFEPTAKAEPEGRSSEPKPTKAVSRRGVWGVSTATAVSLGVMLLCYTPIYPELKAGTGIVQALRPWLGGWSYKSLLMTLWEDFSFVIVAPALTALFQRRYSGPASSKLLSPRYSYAAFLVHTPVSVALEILVDHVLTGGRPGYQPAEWMRTKAWTLVGPTLMTAVMGSLNVVASYALGRCLVDCIPGVGQLI